MSQEKNIKYDHKKIEAIWKEKWYADNIYEAVDFSPKPKKYILAELPYPSGPYLHAGHMMRYTVPDMYSKFLKMRGYNVLYPMGWDSFGLPTEGYAIKANKTPQEVIAELSKGFKKSLQDMGYSFDWNREINTCEPDFYKWTQWIFLKLYEAGLAEFKETSVWWSKTLGILAEEEVINGSNGEKIAERDGNRVERKIFKQWVLKMPRYAQKLLAGLEETNFPDYIKTAQKNWIGKSEGAEVEFKITDETGKEINQLKVFTTRPDTLFGITFLAIAPEHPAVKTLADASTNKDEVLAYVDKAKDRSDMERQAEKEKSGMQIKGIFAKHPFDEVTRKIPIFVADYILMDYATGSIMGVPAHDERDFAFARKYGLDVVEVIKPTEKTAEGTIHTGVGTMVNSVEYNGTASQNFSAIAINRLEKENKGKKATTYKMRDWIFSRQRYWGEPIPLVYKENGNIEAIVSTENMEEVHKKLPLKLPSSKDFQPQADGSPPLSKLTDWVNTVDSQGKPAKRETQTMPTWAGSSWYFLRYIDPHNNNAFADYEKLKYWLPVDKYFGDGGHTTVHLLYSRFWHRFLYDKGLVPTPEPYKWRMTGGLLLGPDGKKMSKRYGNVVMPSDLVENYGADAARLAIAFLGPYDATFPWNENTIKAMWRLVKNIYELKEKVKQDNESEVIKKFYNKMVKNITGMCEALKMNTAISEIMIFVNDLKKAETIDIETWKGFIKVIAPFMPFVAEELWQEINGFATWDKNNSVHWQAWPEFDKTQNINTSRLLPVMINGKVRGQIETTVNDDENSLRGKILNDVKLTKYFESKTIGKFLVVKNKIVSVTTN
ncbi:leucine--tRNA ligase [candidate division WWE3 bacterium CG08_land_8_20_14_0_20_41_10]|uniref:Leucine--tRNA ligase n=1 Tax=candidate division WWE3 bacterium CG08_land_8_20_14_0_20_41_10 TaxID=1975085 RepID=A0A2H0XCE1_UNCKA|nr:MAG: leucine--tRNA ligase [candidate division WWE3 bacterium CG08_land_8_20_14_0_20_41_10]